MSASRKYRFSFFLAVFLGFAALAQPGWSIKAYQIPVPQVSGQSATFEWPSNVINFSQLQQILTQYPGINQFNIQFPNQLNWTMTPNSAQTLLGSVQQEAQSLGVSGPLTNLAFSSLTSGPGIGSGQISIPNLMNGNVTGQLDSVMRELRYQELNLGNGMLPDWLKQLLDAIYQWLLAIYNAICGVFNHPKHPWHPGDK